MKNKHKLNQLILTTCLILILTLILQPQANANQTAQTLTIGDYVTFGRYLNADIKWRVIDKTQDDILLYAENILTYRPYDGALSGTYGQGNSDEGRCQVVVEFLLDNSPDVIQLYSVAGYKT